GMPYVNFRWLGGMLTNFTTIQKRIFYMKELERMEASPEINALSKRERLSIRRELEKLQQTLGGVRDLTRVPDAVFIVDVNTEHTAVREAKRLGITTLALVDSNCDPDDIDFIIAGNDDAIRSAAAVANTLAEAVKEGRDGIGKEVLAPAEPAPANENAPPPAPEPAPVDKSQSIEEQTLEATDG
ncbi:MAG: 30S ribosomal protein S2, partial [Acidimicrobiia bacterium]